MSGIIKLFLLLAIVACISKAQLNEAGQNCLCQRYRNGIHSKKDIKDIQFYPATVFCDRVEIVITSGEGYRYCLNPELEVVKKMITKFLRAKRTSTSKPTRGTVTSGSSSSSSSSISSSSISSSSSSSPTTRV